MSASPQADVVTPLTIKMKSRSSRKPRRFFILATWSTLTQHCPHCHRHLLSQRLSARLHVLVLFDNHSSRLFPGDRYHRPHLSIINVAAINGEKPFIIIVATLAIVVLFIIILIIGIWALAINIRPCCPLTVETKWSTRFGDMTKEITRNSTHSYQLASNSLQLVRLRVQLTDKTGSMIILSVFQAAE